MKKMLGIALIILTAGIMNTATASAIYLGTFEGNDNDIDLIETQINSSINYTGPYVEIAEYSKIDYPDTEDLPYMEITYNDDNKSGTWSTNDPIDFYTVKASNFYAIWWVDPAASNGTWTTEHIINPGGNQPEISHLTAFLGDPSDPPPSNVPEPALLSLLGVSLLTIAGFSRRRKN